MPYLYAHAVKARDTGCPLMRAMLLEFPDDPTSHYLDRQYMLGESLLVAPVFADDGAVTYYLPAGRWTSYLTGEVIEGPRWVTETHSALSLPLMVRPNSILAVGSRDERPDYDYGDGVTLQVYELADGQAASANVPSLSGDVAGTVEAARQGQTITVTVRGQVARWELLLVGVESIASVDGGSAGNDPSGTRIVPDGTDRLTIRLASSA
jgi:alpha-D-xyloside xylohydrolase